VGFPVLPHAHRSSKEVIMSAARIAGEYIPADRLTQGLGEPPGAGVFSYWKMYDDSYLLRTCDGRLAHWDGTDDGKAEWCE
jgi:hypothetical protein